MLSMSESLSNMPLFLLIYVFCFFNDVCLDSNGLSSVLLLLLVSSLWPLRFVLGSTANCRFYEPSNLKELIMLSVISLRRLLIRTFWCLAFLLTLLKVKLKWSIWLSNVSSRELDRDWISRGFLSVSFLFWPRKAFEFWLTLSLYAEFLLDSAICC